MLSTQNVWIFLDVEPQEIESVTDMGDTGLFSGELDAYLLR